MLCIYIKKVIETEVGSESRIARKTPIRSVHHKTVFLECFYKACLGECGDQNKRGNFPPAWQLDVRKRKEIGGHVKVAVHFQTSMNAQSSEHCILLHSVAGLWSRFLNTRALVFSLIDFCVHWSAGSSWLAHQTSMAYQKVHNRVPLRVSDSTRNKGWPIFLQQHDTFKKINRYFL